MLVQNAQPQTLRQAPPRKEAGSVVLPDGESQEYPKAPCTDKVDTVNGIEIADPYRPLENLNTKQTREWVAAENRLTRSYLDSIPEHDEFESALRNVHAKLRRLEDVQDGKLYYSMGVGKQQAVICQSNVDGTGEKVLFDPNTLSLDGHIAVDNWKISPDGTKLALGIRRNGTDEIEWRVRDLATEKTLPERIHNSRYGVDSLSWSEDSKGFYYHKYKEPKPGQEIMEVVKYDAQFYHTVGTPQSQDQKSDTAGLPAQPWKTRGEDGADWTRVGDEGNLSYVLAKGPLYPHGAILSWDENDERQKVLVKDNPNLTLTDVCFANGELVGSYLENAHSRLIRYDKAGQEIGEIALPGMGSVTGLHGGPDGKLIYSYSAPTYPTTIFSFDPQTGESTPIFKGEINYDMDKFTTDLMFAESKDGTKVPVYLTHRKDVPLDGQRPTYMYAYGGFDANETPRFDWTQMPWLDKGGVYASAVLRGGGEFGDEWHKDGWRMRKQNVFDDFIAAGEGLIKQGVTSPEHLGIGGASNGGLLVAATELQRPDLFGAALPQVGVHDMVRFPEYTGGFHWIKEYGEKDKSNLLKNMLTYSPVHNVKDGVAYPPTMVMTGDHDDRVVPSHSYKLAAEMQQSAPEDGNPVLLRTERNIGHGFGEPLDMRIREQADRWAFLWNHIGTPDSKAS